MKRIGYVLLLCLGICACKDKSKFVISGEFTNATPQSKVYLFAIQKDNAVVVDSTVFSEKGEFKFTHSTPGADFFRINSGGVEYLFIAKNGDEIKISADLLDKGHTYTLSGAEEADKMQELNATRNQYIGRMNEIQRQFDEAVEAQPGKRDMVMQQMQPKFITELQGMEKAELKFAEDNTASLAGFYAISLLNASDHEKEMVAYADKIKGKFNDNPTVTSFIVKMANLKTVQVGQIAPEFTINGLDGKPIKLADFKGKYVLVDFWASWCMPCRQENPNLVKAYNAFKDRNFTILGISLDKDPGAWKQAIAADKLTWNHASELKDFEGQTVKLYQVEAIPTSYLLDPNGKIIAKSLRGEELYNFLNTTLR